MNFKLIQQIMVQECGLPGYHMRALTAALTRGGEVSFETISSWPKMLKERLMQSSSVASYQSALLTQATDGSAKGLLTFADKEAIETVLIAGEANHYSVCVSCQSGCAMGCAFCATGSMGLRRSLSTEEICDQWLYWRTIFPEKVPKSVVFMGMGEPFANQAAVFEAIGWLHDYYGLGYRHMTVSTCGLVEGIGALAATYPQVNLAISLHAATQPLREQLMPIAKQVPLPTLAGALVEYMKKTNRQVTFEYLLLDGVNDTREALEALIAWLAPLPQALVHVNLIRYNQTAAFFRSPSGNRVRFVLDYLKQKGVSVTLRKSAADSIEGACGQLAIKKK